MLAVISPKDREKWNLCVKSFQQWDIYYLCEYAESFELHGDGAPLLIYYEDDKTRFCYVVMKKDIAESALFGEKLPRGLYFDFETPYGYGGILCDGTVPKDSQKRFGKELGVYCLENHIISQFIRFHPLLSNYDKLELLIEKRYMHDTIYMDTTSQELIFSNMDSKNRNMVRKAVKSGVTIVQKPVTEYAAFMDMYVETMKKNNAGSYYTFHEDYFEFLKSMEDCACIFYAVYEGKPISGAIMYFNNQFMHYHLSGTHTEYRKYSPGNLLLYEAACRACEKGIKMLHLGGGMSADDSLFGFKKQFNKNGRLPFYIGRTIFNEGVYQELLQIRKGLDADFKEDNHYMIQYRSP